MHHRICVFNCRVNIVTDLFISDASLSIANFVKLVGSNWYRPLEFIASFRILLLRDGCSKTNGYGAPDHVVASEFGSLCFEGGSTWYVSAGKDMEGRQFFIIRIATPPLDGRYFLFGRVIEGWMLSTASEQGTR